MDTVKATSHTTPYRSATLPVLLAFLLLTCLCGRAARADSVASLQAGAYPATPAVVGPGDSYSIQFWSTLQPGEPGVENLIDTGETWVITSVEYSEDDVNWTTIWSASPGSDSADVGVVGGIMYDCSFSLGGYTGGANLDATTHADTPDGFYLINVSDTANYEATVNGQLKQGSAGPATASGTGVVAQITGITLGSPATKTNMKQDTPNTGDINYGAIEAANTNAKATATTSPSTTPVENKITWNNGTAITGNNAERNYSLATSQKYTIDPTLGGHAWAGHNVYLWVIWAKVTVNLNGTISPNDKASYLVNGDWPTNMGGGKALGPLDWLQNNNLTFLYTTGKYEAQATLKPPGVWNAVASGAWYLDRKWAYVAYQNGGHYANLVWLPGADSGSGPDNDTAEYEYVKPTNQNGGTIYDLDGPGIQTIFHDTAEDYTNFTEYAVVTLDKQYPCSDSFKFYYEARADLQNKVVPLNQLGSSWIKLPNKPFYTKRP